MLQFTRSDFSEYRLSSTDLRKGVLPFAYPALVLVQKAATLLKARGCASLNFLLLDRQEKMGHSEAAPSGERKRSLKKEAISPQHSAKIERQRQNPSKAGIAWDDSAKSFRSWDDQGGGMPTKETQRHGEMPSRAIKPGDQAGD
jgi:hypothetical protein